MDSLIVDLDKVLDDFEAEEKASSQLPGQETKPSDFAHYVALKEDRPWEDQSQVPLGTDTTWKLYPSHEHKLNSGGYDDPYIPVENFDLSEADFAPSVITADKSHLKIENAVDRQLNNHFQKDENEKGYDKSLQKSDVVIKSNLSSQRDDSLGLPKIQNSEKFQYISVNNAHIFEQHNGTVENGGDIQNHVINKNATNEKHSRPSGFGLYNLPSPNDKFPIQARDEFTPVYENQPFPPDLAPAVNARASMNGSLNVIPEHSYRFDDRSSLDSDKLTLGNSLDRMSSDNSLIGSDSSETVPKTLSQSINTELNSQASSLSPHTEDRSVNDGSLDNSLTTQSLRESQPLSDSQGADSLSSNYYIEPQSPQYVLTASESENQLQDYEKNVNEEKIESGDQMNREEIVETQAMNKNDLDQDCVSETTQQPNISDSSVIVGFSDMNVEMADNDLDSYLGDVTQESPSEQTRNEVVSMESSTSQYDKIRESSPLQYGSLENFRSNESKQEDVCRERSPEFSGNNNSNLPSYDQLHPDTLTCNSNSTHAAIEGYTSSAVESEVSNEEISVKMDDTPQEKTTNDQSSDSNDHQSPSKRTLGSGGARPKELPKQSTGTMPTNDSSNNDNESLITSSQIGASNGIMECAEMTVDTEVVSDTNLSGIQVYPKESQTAPPQTEEELDADLAAAIALSLKDIEGEVDDKSIPQAQNGDDTSPQNSESVDQISLQQRKRPNSLNLPPLGEGNSGAERSHAPYTFPYPREQESSDVEQVDTPDNVPEVVEDETIAQSVQDNMAGATGVTPSQDSSLPTTPPPPYMSTTLGKIAPTWIPDAEAPNCMGCESKFTFTKRRHHCRACGKVFCSTCCNMKSKLQYMENKEARVCHPCHQTMTIGSQRKSEPKHVMFSDGICPGGDLTELDGSNEATSRLPPRRSSRSQRKVEKGSPDSKHHARRVRASESKNLQCLIPETGLPPVVLATDSKGEYTMDSNPDSEKYIPQMKEEDGDPVVFAVNNNLLIMVKIISLDCCVNRTCWCFTSKGMCNVGQDEIVIVLETLPEEKVIPRDIFCHFHTVFEEAGKGNTVSDMGHSIFNQSFLDSRDHGGFLYIRPTFQCLHKLILPTPPYVFGILLQKWETPWAKVFPIRLMLRLGAEYRYYPCPLISVRNRKPVFFEIGHTIMNLLADFRNYQYMLPQIKGVSIHMEDKKTCINFPRNRYDDLMKVVANSNEHVMAVGACFSTEADSHLVCIQNDEGNYQTQAINIQNKPRKVTGASFVVFNGALKTSLGLKAKSSIVEDGLMVQITPESMAALKKAMKEMKEYTIECGVSQLLLPDEVVEVKWIRDDKNINIGQVKFACVKSPIDGMAMDGIESLHIPNATDYVGEHRMVRWTDVFFIQNLDSGSAKWEPVDLSKLADTLANATCIALTPHLDKLREAALVKIGLRVTIETEKVGYEVGANEERLPDTYMNDLDNELIPVIHSAASQNHGGSIILELVFHVLD
ncbi:hypothetical protein FSP39_017895 [Pinctada imbricata]|uniref:FYVE-type domain-containing protein n=1 Tax=Pinctada imbricata TaxID=66713 RepID=A0AA88YXC3_PINIB|nr:hypothetical protein FSP39_017895 [Pinctada imbricata]